MHQAFSAAENRRARLLIDCLGRNETHLGLACCDENRFGISLRCKSQRYTLQFQKRFPW